MGLVSAWALVALSALAAVAVAASAWRTTGRPVRAGRRERTR